jgi:hypothetical protein
MPERARQSRERHRRGVASLRGGPSLTRTDSGRFPNLHAPKEIGLGCRCDENRGALTFGSARRKSGSTALAKPRRDEITDLTQDAGVPSLIPLASPLELAALPTT